MFLVIFWYVRFPVSYLLLPYHLTLNNPSPQLHYGQLELDQQKLSFVYCITKTHHLYATVLIHRNVSRKIIFVIGLRHLRPKPLILVTKLFVRLHVPNQYYNQLFISYCTKIRAAARYFWDTQYTHMFNDFCCSKRETKSALLHLPLNTPLVLLKVGNRREHGPFPASRALTHPDAQDQAYDHHGEHAAGD